MVVSAQSRRGLGWIVAAFFIVADVVGGGIVAMPVAFLQTGIALSPRELTFQSYHWCIISDCDNNIFCLHGLFTWPKLDYHAEAMAYLSQSLSKTAARIVYLTMFGTSVVFILLSSKILQNFLASFFDANISLCYLLCVVAIAIMPLTYLKSPADFWLAVLVAMMCTMLAVLLIGLGISIDIDACISEAHYPKASVSGAVVSLGTFLFAFSGHQVFPTIQHDMHRPADFSKSIILGNLFTLNVTVVALLYMPLSVYGYLTYGSSMRSSIIDSVQTSWIRHAANLTIALHCILAVIIMVNPLNQQAEHFFNAPHC
ncbi:unnamed protein product [Litomosoides sigmodontis]|uniref:Amino acid transporter transmembrane domain-containing protein n=1 Tax=Litomosoides sigmodontis TaxID=42156 RepID=A0A3P7KGD6_LITSI|nr:unnamed protein product [Litomosoides sigmodontis]